MQIVDTRTFLVRILVQIVDPRTFLSDPETRSCRFQNYLGEVFGRFSEMLDVGQGLKAS